MGAIIGPIFFTLVLFVALGVKVGNDGYSTTVSWGIKKRQIFSLLGLLTIVFSMYVFVPANTVAIKFDPLNGGVQNDTLNEGLNFKNPVTTIYYISTEVQSKAIENLYGQTSDSQYLTIAVDVKYRVNKANGFNVFKKFRTLDAVDEQLIKPSVQKSIEMVTTQYNIIEILGEKRNEVYVGIEADLTDRLAIDGIELHSITFIDTDAGSAIENAILQEAVAKKAVETAEQERQKAEIDAERKIIEAQADADAKLIDAEAEAKAKEIVAAAISKNKDILELEWIKKWNGILPEMMLGNDTSIIMPMD